MSEYVDLSRFRRIRFNFFRWRYESSYLEKFMLATLFACFTGLAAQLYVLTPFSPVPFTGQVIAVLLSGILLGKWWGGASQAMYVALGAIGVPWFYNSGSGTEVLFGHTGGFLIGFVAASALIGGITDRYVRARTITGLMPLLLLGVVIIYAFGALGFSLVMHTNMWDTVSLAVLPFVPFDIAKAVMVACIGVAITPKVAFDAKPDARKVH